MSSLTESTSMVLVGEGYDRNNNKVAVVSAEDINDNMTSLVFNREQAKIVAERLKEMFDL